MTKIWDRGVARGELDANVDPEVALDLIFAPAVYRMATGHGALTRTMPTPSWPQRCGHWPADQLSGRSRPLRSDAVSDALVPGAGERIYDYGPASSPRSCMSCPCLLDVGLVGGGGRYPSSAASSRN